MRKGQNLAVESVATFGLTLIAAIGVVQMFGEVNQGIVSSTEETQAQVISDKLRITLLEMRSGSDDIRQYHQLELPEELAGKDYRIAFQKDEILIFTDDSNYQQTFNAGSQSISMNGSVEGGSIRIFKNQKGYKLRSGR